MRALLTAIGSDGDVEPFIALAQRLQASNHSPTLAASPRYETRIRSLGIPFAPVGAPWDDGVATKLFETVLAEPKPLRQLVLIVDGLIDEQCAAVRELQRLARESDVVVYPPLFVAAVAAARATRTKHVSVHFAPLHRAQKYSPFGTNFGRYGNALLWSLASKMLRRGTDASLNRVVNAAGLPPWRDILLESCHSTLLDLVAVSPSVIPKDALWGPRTEVTGYWFVRPSPPDASVERLEEFLRGEKAVVIGLGSMMGFDSSAATSLILEAVRGIEGPVILQSGWAKLGARELPANVRVAGFVPHSWLFERALCAVHHGGAGTTAAAFRAGIPQAIAWHLGDQPAWGRLVEKLGVGPKARSRREVDSRWLSRAIDTMLTNTSMRRAAAQLGKTIRQEDGVGVAVRAIEEAVR